LRSPGGHCRGGLFRRPVHHASTFLRPFARRALTRLIATMDALTPGQLSATVQVSLLHVHGLSNPSASNHRCPAVVAFARYPSARRLPRLRHCVDGSRLRPYPAGSPGTPGRNEFLTLRTGRSPPAASHPASRRMQLQSVTGRRAYAWRGLSPLWPCTPAGALGGVSPSRDPQQREDAA
jgi:hypothetical protein